MNTLRELFFIIGETTLFGLGILLCIAIWIILVIGLYLLGKDIFKYLKSSYIQKHNLKTYKKLKGEHND